MKRGHVAVLGGGLAGMSAAAALCREGYRVTLLEKRNALGGRAGSHWEAATGEWIDNCQHVLMPCCTNLLDFYERIGVRDRIRFYRKIPFIDRQGHLSMLRDSALPAPFHCAGSFLALPFLSFAEKIGIARALASILRLGESARTMREPARPWFEARGQTPGAISHFWEMVLVSALNETLDRAALGHAAKVFSDAFLSNAEGWWLGIPTVPLGSLYGEPFMTFVSKRGGEVRLEATVERLVQRGSRISEAVLGDGTQLTADHFIVALPWQASHSVIPPSARPAEKFETLEPSPITGVHLFFDRAVTNLEFAALPGRPVHWFFNKTSNFGGRPGHGSYLQLVTSASRDWMPLAKKEILEICLRELGEALPDSLDARLIKSYVLKEPAATFSPSPESEPKRPSARTALGNLFLAGDWTQTGWPATMEGAVRGGYLAAEALLQADGKPTRVLAPDLPPSGLVRLLGIR